MKTSTKAEPDFEMKTKNKLIIRLEQLLLLFVYLLCYVGSIGQTVIGDNQIDYLHLKLSFFSSITVSITASQFSRTSDFCSR